MSRGTTDAQEISGALSASSDAAAAALASAVSASSQRSGTPGGPERRSNTPGGIPDQNTASGRLAWHSRSDSTSSKDNEARFEVPCSTEGPRYSVSHEMLSMLSMTASQRRYLVVMVGLPARGKTFIAQKLARMLAWLGHGAVVHNVQAAYRASLNPPRRLQLSDFDFRDESSEVFANYVKALDRVGEQVSDFFTRRHGLVAFVNDDCVSERIRQEIEARVGKFADQTIYVEVTRDAEINIKNDLEKILNPREFGNVTSDAQLTEARSKFYDRVALLRQQYTPVKDHARSWIQLHNNTQLQACNVRGYVPSRLTSTLLNLGSQRRRYPIYFSRHGESKYNLEDRIGGDPPLSDKGQRDALYLRDFVGLLVHDYKRRVAAEEELSIPAADREPPPQIWSSQLLRTMQTSQPAVDAFALERITWHHLNEIHAGVCEDMTYTEVKERYPSIDHFRGQAKYSFRYPQGESYQDIVQRLEPIILELENAEREVVVVAHQAVLRCLLSYFGHKSAESSVHQTVPHRTIWRCTYNADGVSMLDELKLPLNEEALEELNLAGAAEAGRSSMVMQQRQQQAPSTSGSSSPTAGGLDNRMALAHSGMLGGGEGGSSATTGSANSSSGVDGKKFDTFEVAEK